VKNITDFAQLFSIFMITIITIIISLLE